MTEQKFTTTSGREVIMKVSDQGEPESITIDGVTLSELDVIEINQFVEDNDDDN